MYAIFAGNVCDLLSRLMHLSWRSVKETYENTEYRYWECRFISFASIRFKMSVKGIKNAFLHCTNHR